MNFLALIFSLYKMSYVTNPGNYARLASYNGPTQGSMMPARAVLSPTTIIPAFGTSGYSALTHGLVNPSSNYFSSLDAAYSPGSANCGSYGSAFGSCGFSY